MAPATTDPFRDYFDMLAVTLASAAKWWRTRLSERSQALMVEQLDTFERHLCLGMVKLLLSNALERGLSWREWTVQAVEAPDKLLKEAASAAGIDLYFIPAYTRMWLRSTGDQVHVHVRSGRRGAVGTKERQVWPLQEEVTQETAVAKKPYTGPPRMYPVHPNDHQYG